MRSNHRYAHCALFFSRKLTDQEINGLLAISGIRERKNKNAMGTVLHVPYHAIPVAQRFIQEWSLPLTNAHWIIQPSEPKTWSEYQAILREQEEVQDWVLEDFLTPYQIDALATNGHKIGAHLWHPTGSGKTLTGILWCLIPPKTPIIVVTRAASRIQYGREFGKYTNLKAHVIRPTTKKNPVTLEDYYAWCKERQQRPIVVVGWESLTHHIDKLKILAQYGASVVFDESHRGKSAKRWQAVPLPEPSESDDPIAFFSAQKREAKRQGGFIPKAGDSRYSGPDLGRVMIIPRMNTTTAASELAKASNRVINTTATPIKDRVRDLWAQLDLAEPYSWGGASNWMFRYAGAHEGKYGGLDTSGASNQNELAERLDLVVHRVAYEDTHRHLPKKRRQSVYIAPEDQCRATAGFASELRNAKKRGATAILEVKLAQSASKKRRAVLGMVEDHVSSGHKVTIFTARRRDVEKLGQDIEKLKMVKKHRAKVWYAHGGTDTSVRAQIVLDYKDYDGPCVLVATGASFGEAVDGLQCTNAALFVQLPYTAGDLRQWEGRFTRLGMSSGGVVIYYIICEDTVDEHIADIIISKLDAIRRISQDNELAEAEEILAGIDDEEAIMASILEKLEGED